jgi:hypothetical protein
MTAACLSTNYLLIGVTNVKFMDLIVFVSGIVFGPFVGASIGVLTWLVYRYPEPLRLLPTHTGSHLHGREHIRSDRRPAGKQNGKKQL